jgi:hypothetical protein
MLDREQRRSMLRTNEEKYRSWNGVGRGGSPNRLGLRTEIMSAIARAYRRTDKSLVGVPIHSDN